MTVALCAAVCCVAYAAGSAVVCVLVNREKPAGMPALVHAACRSLHCWAAARWAARRPAQPRHTHRRTA